MAVVLQPFSLERIQQAVVRIRDRLLRATGALEDAGVPYAVVGGNAVAAWVSRVDESAVRNTRDVDILLERQQLGAAQEALERKGFVYRHVRGLDIFRDGPEASVRDSLHVIFAGERPAEFLVANPTIDDSECGPQFRVISLEGLVRMKLNSWRDKDRMHLQDLWEVGLIDGSWVQRVPPELSERLQEVLDTAEKNCSLSYRTREIEE
jgi:hypothetical protein